MKDNAKAVARWFREHRVLGSVITAIAIFLGVRYFGEVIAAFLSGRSLDFAATWSGESLDSTTTWVGMIIAGLVIVAFYGLVKYLFRRYFREP